MARHRPDASEKRSGTGGRPGRAARGWRAWLPLAVVACVAVAVVVALFVEPSRAVYHPDRITLTTATGDHAFTVEWATTPAERSQGLMYRETMAEDHGMVFDFGQEQPVSFWMRNTVLSLDMVFIHADGTVYRIERDTEPYSLTPIPSGADVRYVLEVLGGTSERIGLKPGDHADLE
jgi:uncharacterized membrane protein (UPF0127 family)